MSWLKNALHQVQKPKDSVIGVLKKHLGGPQPGRSREQLHASDMTKIDFCPRQWAFFDLLGKKAETEFLAVAMDVTYQMGVATETLLVEEWAGDSVIGNWKCRHCDEQRTMTSKPAGYCKTGRKHWWRYVQVVIEAPEYAANGSIDALFNVGVPKLLITECKTIAPQEFEKLLVPYPEHRLRTNLYMKLVEDSTSPWKATINTQEARVLYVSRAYGKANQDWGGEILPFKEFVVKRDDAVLQPQLQKAKALKVFRETNDMPDGICATALDKTAKNCSCCQYCFSGQFPAKVKWSSL